MCLYVLHFTTTKHQGMYLKKVRLLDTVKNGVFVAALKSNATLPSDKKVRNFSLLSMSN